MSRRAPWARAVEAAPNGAAFPFPRGAAADDDGATCRACGACCATSFEWPRFSLEDDAALALIPPALINDRGNGMRCNGDRCEALAGEIGSATSCTIYDVRPDVCRACLPGDDACLIARRRHDL